jgi:hypothetical protein
MNQRQVRYLDNRIQEEKNRLYSALTKKYKELKKNNLNGLVEAFQRMYREKLRKLDKEDIIERFLPVFENCCREWNDYGSYDRYGIIKLNDDLNVSINDPRATFEIDGFVEEWNKRSGELERSLEKEEQQAYDDLNKEVSALRDRINLGDATEAAKSLEEFVAKWTKIIDDAEKKDATNKPSRKRK